MKLTPCSIARCRYIAINKLTSCFSDQFGIWTNILLTAISQTNIFTWLIALAIFSVREYSRCRRYWFKSHAECVACLSINLENLCHHTHWDVDVFAYCSSILVSISVYFTNHKHLPLKYAKPRSISRFWLFPLLSNDKTMRQCTDLWY